MVAKEHWTKGRERTWSQVGKGRLREVQEKVNDMIGGHVESNSGKSALGG